MGYWGTAISSNDTFADIYGEFFDLYNDGLDVSEISEKLIARHQDTIDDPEDCNNFWFALAKAQWECKKLDSGVFNRVKEIIETGADLEVWRQCDADEKDLKKRRLFLDRFLTDLRTERPKAKTRKKKRIWQPVFEKGDCLTFRLENGNYGGAIVLEAIRDIEYGHNLIATTRINQPDKPTKKDFESAEILVMNYANWDNEPSIQWYLPIRHKQVAHLIEKADTMNIQTGFDLKNANYLFVADFDIWFIHGAEQQFKSEETKPRPTIKLTVKGLTKKKWWKIWKIFTTV